MNEQNESLVKSMEFCQGSISRMAENSFKLKSWFLVTFTALFAFFAKSLSGESNYQSTSADLFWLLPLMVFPVLDAYYLKQERMFRSVYDDFAKSIADGKTHRVPFNLKPSVEQRSEFTLLNVVYSISIGWLYFPMLTAFQGLVIFHSNVTYPFFSMSIFPGVMGVMALVFRMKTSHQQPANS